MIITLCLLTEFKAAELVQAIEGERDGHSSGRVVG
jgi:hypothetical protein